MTNKKIAIEKCMTDHCKDYLRCCDNNIWTTNDDEEDDPFIFVCIKNPPQVKCKCCDKPQSNVGFKAHREWTSVRLREAACEYGLCWKLAWGDALSMGNAHRAVDLPKDSEGKHYLSLVESLGTFCRRSREARSKYGLSRHLDRDCKIPILRVRVQCAICCRIFNGAGAHDQHSTTPDKHCRYLRKSLTYDEQTAVRGGIFADRAFLRRQSPARTPSPFSVPLPFFVSAQIKRMMDDDLHKTLCDYVQATSSSSTARRSRHYEHLS